MPLTLYRYILVALVKLLLLTTAVLIVALAVGFAIEPISEGTLGAAGLAKLILFVMPGMLTYALPIAATFAATLVFFRLAVDNEITAAAVSGVSYSTLLMPVALLGLAVTVAMFFLSNYVIPSFWLRAEQVLQRDVATMIVQRINRHDVVRFGEYVLYADRADAPAPIQGAEAEGDADPMTLRPEQRIVLEHVAVGKLAGGTMRMEADFTAELAAADLYRLGEQLFISVKLTDATVQDPRSGTIIAARSVTFPQQRVPSFFETEPKFLSLPRLHEMAAQPGLNPDIRELTRELREALDQQDVVGFLWDRLRDGKWIDLVGPQGERYQLTAPPARVAAGEGSLTLIAAEGEPVRVRVGSGIGPTQRLEAARATVRVEPSEVGDRPNVNLRLHDVTVIDPRLPTPNQAPTLYLNLLRVDRPTGPDRRHLGALELLRIAEQSPAPPIDRAAGRLAGAISGLRENITTTIHERGSMAVMSLMVMLLGAVMSMKLRHETPLVIFFWCFLPAIAAVLMVNGGENIIEAEVFGAGLWFDATMIWSGNIFLALLIWLVYVKLARH